jgi:glycosyltransferase involved in cell wall biosynthesis
MSVITPFSSNQNSIDEFSVLNSQPEKNSNSDRVAILMCTYQGQRFLIEQLASFENQTHTNWELWASDDGSDDGTIEVLKEFKNRFRSNKVSIIKGSHRGFLSNFLFLNCNKNIDTDYYAYSDQDDIWKPNKIERAIRYLKEVSNNVPILYCSRTELINSSGKHIGFSPLFKKPPRFENALLQNIGGGNTMVFNRAARSLLMSAGEHVSVVSHDWWTYQLVSGAGGHVYYDQQPSVLYRQHEKNIIGENDSWIARLKRIHMLLQGRFREWNDRNTAELLKINHILTDDNQRTLKNFRQCRQSPLLKRLYLLNKCRLYRQTLLGNLGLIAAVLLNKL